MRKSFFLLSILFLINCKQNADTEELSEDFEPNVDWETAADDEPQTIEIVSSDSKSPKDFIPQGWKLILEKDGDLNKDGLADKVMIIEENNPSNLKSNEGLGTDMLNLNPRNLLVLFQKPDATYTLAAQNSRGFIPPENSDLSVCLIDPLMDNGGIDISKNILKIDFHYWLSCGSWYVNHATYTFRFQNNRFQLIGFDHYEFHRSSGEENSTSINFSTKKMSNTTGDNMFDDKESNPTTTWTTLKNSKLYNLEECSDTTYFEILDIKRS